MEEAKTYVFKDDVASNGLLSLLGPMLQQRNIDPAYLLALQNNNGFGNEGMWFIWIIFMWFMWGGNGFGGFGRNGAGLANEINNDYGRELLLQAINGNGNAISQLATTLNCDINAVQTALNAVQSNIQSVGNQVGMSSQQIINAIQAGDAGIASQLASCCCTIREEITRSNYENQIATSNQTNILSGKIDQQTNLINDKFCQLEMRDMQSKIDSLRDERSALLNQLSQEHQTAALQAYQAQSLIPVNAALGSLQNEINSIKCKLPETATVPYSPVFTMPSCVAAQFGLYGNGFGGFGFGNTGYWG